MSLTTRPAGAGGVCSSEGGTVEGHAYDVANRLTDQGVVYEPFGETSRLPASDAGGSELHSTFYADGQLHEQFQNGQSIGYALDPAGRPQETIDTGIVDSTYVSHYAGAGGSPSWTVEPTSGHWTRYVPEIGGFAAIETDTEAPVLQLQDLQGNVVATASCSETATKLLSTERSTEYGVPTSTKPAKYGWLGGSMNPTELSSGVVAMGARSYVPQLGRYLQTDPVEGGSANAYAYVFGDPVNSQDPSGEDANGPSAWAIGLANEITGQEVSAYEQAKREEAERKAAEAAAAAAAYAALEAATALPMPTEGGVEEGPIVVEQLAQPTTGGEPVAVAAAPCAHEENPNSGYCGPGLPHGKLHEYYRYHYRVIRKKPRDAPDHKLKLNARREVGACMAGAIAGGVAATFSSAGLATEAGAYAGCFVAGSVVMIFESL